MYTIQRDARATPSLRGDRGAIPVNEPYLERLLQEQGIRLAPGTEVRVEPCVALSAIEEALSSVEFQLEGLNARKHALLSSWCHATDDEGHSPEPLRRVAS